MSPPATSASLTARAKALAFFCHDLDGGAQDPAAKALLTSYRRRGNTLGGAAGTLGIAIAGTVLVAVVHHLLTKPALVSR